MEVLVNGILDLKRGIQSLLFICKFLKTAEGWEEVCVHVYACRCTCGMSGYHFKKMYMCVCVCVQVHMYVCDEYKETTHEV